MNEQLLTIQEAAKFLNVSTKTLRRWDASGKLQPERTVGNQRRYTLSELQAFIQQKPEEVKEGVMENVNESEVVSDNPAPIVTPLTNAQEAASFTTAQGSTVKSSPATSNERDLNDASSLNTSAQPYGFNQVPDSAFTSQEGQLESSQSAPKGIKVTQFLSSHPRYAIAFAGAMSVLLLMFLVNVQAQTTKSNLFANENDRTKAESQSRASQPVNERAPLYRLNVGVPSMFGKPVTFLDTVGMKKQLTVEGISILSGGIDTKNADIDAGTGTLTASNVVYSMLAGSNITITGDPQNPTISANLGGQQSVTSFQGQSGVVELAQGSGIGLDGLTITNTGVLSVQGQSGSVAFSQGAGITLNGLTITNSDPGTAQKIFGTFRVGTTDITAGSNIDTFTFAAGSGITLSPDTTGKTLTISASSSAAPQWITTGSDIYYNTGNVGIGNTAPGRALDVTGTGRFSGALTLSSLGAGVVKSDAVGLLSSSAIGLGSADVTGTLGVGNGGTGMTATPTNGQLLIGNGSGYGLATLTGTTNQISIGNGAGSITLATPQDIHTGATPTFGSLSLTANTNQLVLGSANTGTITLAALSPGGQVYTLPDASGEICLTSGNCTGAGGSLTGAGTTNYIPKFTSSSGLGNSIIYESSGKIGIGTTSPTGLFSVSGASTGQALVSLNETGNQNILVGSASGTTRFAFDRSGNLNITGGAYIINGTSVLSADTLGLNVFNSSLRSVGTLEGGSISNTFGNIDVGTDSIAGGNITASGTTGFTASGIGSGLTFSGSGNHDITAPGGTLRLGAVTLTGAVAGNTQNITGLGNLAAGGTVTFSGLGTGVIQSNASGLLSSAALNLAGGTSYVSGTLPVTNGGTGLSSFTTGDLVYASAGNTLAALPIGSNGQILAVSGSGAPQWISSGVINFWQRTNGALAPLNISDDFLLGATATSSARFAFKNVSSGTPTASLSAGTSGATYLTADGNLATTNRQTLTIGSGTTGNIVLSGFGAGIIRSNASGVLSSGNINLGSSDVTGTLAVVNGGTGVGTFEANGVLYGNDTGAIGVVTPGTDGQLFLGQTSAAPIFQTLGGDATINASGSLTIANNAVALGTDTTGNYVSNLAAGSGLAITGTAGENWTPTVALGALTADWNQTGAFDIRLNNAGSELKILEATGDTFYGIFDVADLTASDKTYTFPNGTGTVCLAELGNCAGSGSGVTTAGGTTNRLAKFTGSQAIGNASIDDLYTAGVALTITAAGNVGIGATNPTAVLQVNGGNTGGNAATIVNQTGASTNDIFTASASGTTRFTLTNNGTVQFAGGSSFLQTLTSNAAAAKTYNLPTFTGANADICLTTGNCAGVGGTGDITAVGSITSGDAFSDATADDDWLGLGSSAGRIEFDDQAIDEVNILAAKLGVGTQTPNGLLDVTGAVTGKALAIFNETGNQNILTASASGVSKFTVDRNGNLGIGGSAVSSSNYITAPNFALNTSGQITAGVWQGTAIAPQYGGTGDDTSGTTGVAYVNAGNWQYESQLSTARGGTGADFASVTQGSVPYFSATGVMSALAPSTAGFVLTTNGTNQNPTWTNPASLGTNFLQRNLGVLSPVNITDDLAIGGTATSSSKFQVFGNTGNATTSGTLTFNAAGSIQTTNNQTLTIGGSSTGTIVLSPSNGTGLVTVNGTLNGTTGINTGATGGTQRINSSGNLVNIGTIDSTYLDTTTNVVNLAASTVLQFAGTTVIDASRNLSNIVGLSTSLTPTSANTYSIGTAVGNQLANVYSQAIYQNNNQVCDTGGNCNGLTVTYWDQANGALSPKNATVDLLVGGTSTGSAKFAVLNVNNGTPTASVSAGTNGAAYLSAAGDLQTTANQSLSFGGNTTGNIILNGDGSNRVGIGTNTPLYTLDVNGQFRASATSNAIFGNGTTGGIQIGDGAITKTSGSSFTFDNGIIPSSDNTRELGNLSNRWNALSVGTGTSSFAGNVGIGTTVPTAPLDVAGAASVSGSLSFRNGTGSIQTTGMNSLTIGGSTTGDLTFSGRNGANNGIIFSGYNCSASANGGVLTTDASGRITCADDDGGGAAPTLQTTYGNDADGSDAIIALTGSDDSLIFRNPATGGTDSGFLFNLDQLATTATDALVINSAGSDASFGLRVNDDGTASDSTPFVIDNTGNVGIGVTTPTAKLDVAGAASVSGALNFRTGAGAIQTTANNTLTLGGNTTGNIVITPNNGTGGLLTLNGNFTQAGANAFTTGTGLTTVGGNLTVNGTALTLANNSTVALGTSTTALNFGSNLLNLDTTNTRVGINTNAPTATLDVNGAASVSGTLNFRNGTGSIQTTGMNSLTIGGSTTGDLTFSGRNGANNGVIFSGYNCSGNVNGGVLTTDASGRITCADDEGGGAAPTLQTTYGNDADGSDAIIALTGTDDSLIFRNPASGGTDSGFLINLDQLATSATDALVINSAGADASFGLRINDDGTASDASPFVVNNTGTVGIGTTAPTALLDVAGAASVSGSLSFRNGAGAIQTTGNNTLTLGGNSTGNIVFNPLNGAGTVRITSLANCSALEADATGIVTCGTDDVGSAGTNYWQLNNGTISPFSNTLDLLVGGTSSSSAKFAILNVNNGTPTASVSAGPTGAAYLTATGTLQTTANQTLTLGGDTTGNIILNPLNGSGYVRVNGLANCTAIEADANGNLTCGSDAGGSGLAGVINVQNNDVAVGTDVDTLDYSTDFSVSALPANEANISIADDILNFTEFADSLSLDAATSLSLSNFDFTLGTNAGNGGVVVAPNAGGKAALIVNKQGTSGDIFTASSSGTTRFSILNNGDVRINALNTANCDIKADATGLLFCGTDTSGGVSNYWQLNNGTVSPFSETLDLLVGGTASNSAKFAVLNMTGSGTPTASVSAIATGNGIALGGDGTIQSLRNNTLVLGGNTTGNITLDEVVNLGSATTGLNVTTTGVLADIDGTIVNINDDLEIEGNDILDSASETRISLGDNTTFTNTTTTLSGTTTLTASSLATFTTAAALSLGSTTTLTLGSNATINGGTAANDDLTLQGTTNATRTTSNVLLQPNGGSVGIGTTTPTALLDVAGTASVSGSLNFRNGTGSIQTTGMNSLTIGGSSTGDLTFSGRNGASNGIIFSGYNCSGNANGGALTTDANGRITCADDDGGGAAPTLQTTYGNDADGADAIIALTGTDDSLIFRNPTTGGTDSGFLFNLDQLATTATDALVINSAGADTSFGLRVNDDGTASDASPFVVTNTGTVGIGTTAPTALLDVAGAASVSGALNFRTGAGAIQTTANNTLTLGGNTTGNIVITPNNGTGGLLTLNGNFTQAGANAFTTGTGLTTVGGNLTVNGTALTLANNSTLTLGASSTALNIASGLLNFDTSNTRLGVNTTAPTATLDIRGSSGTTPVASLSGQTSNAGLIVDNNGVGDIFTASKSGASKFTILNNGNIQINNLNTASCDVKADTSGILSCGTDNGGVNYWQLNNGTVSPFSNTLDLLVGGTSTASAKFAFFNVNSGTPTASISAITGDNALSLNATGTIGTTNAQTLTLGSSSTGNVALSPGGATVLTAFANGNVGIGTTTPNALLDVAGTASISGSLSLYGTPTIQSLAKQTLTLGSASTGNIAIGTDATARNVTIGNSTGTSSLNFTSGTGTQTYTSSATTGTAFSNVANAITSGTALSVSSTGTALSSGRLLTLSKTGASGSTAFTGDIANIAYSQTFNGGVGLSHTGNVLDISRAITLNTAQTHTITGALATLSDSATQSLGTLNSSADVLQISQNYAANTGSALNLTSATTTGFVFRANDDGTFTDTSPFIIDASGNVGVGTTAPLATLDIRGTSGTTPVASLSGQTSNAGLIVDNNGVGDIFTASKSGASKFTILNNGNIQINNLNAASCDVKADTSGILSCGTDAVGSASNYFQLNNGTVSPFSNTLDLLVGGTSTASAKFAFYNVNNGTPTASISAQSGTNSALVLGADSVIQSVNNQTLTLGGGTTGNIVLAPLGGSGNVLSTGDINLASGKGYQLNGTTVLSGTTLGSTITASSLDSVDVLDAGSISTNFGAINVGDDLISGGNLTSTGTTGLTLSAIGSDISFSAASGTNIIGQTGGGTGVLQINAFTLGGGITGAGNVVTGLGQLTVDNLSLDGNTVSSITSGDLILGSVGGNVVLSDNVRLNIGGNAAADPAYNIIGDTIAGVSPNINSDDDLFIEGDLDVLGVTSVSGTLQFRSGTSAIQTSANQTLTLGGTTTGDIVIAENTYLGSATTGLNVTTAGVISDVDGTTVEINDDLTVSGGEIIGTAATDLLNTVTTTLNFAGAATTLNIADSVTTKTIDIGGVTASGTDTVNISTNGTLADVITIGNSNAATTLALTGGDDWSITPAGVASFSASLSFRTGAAAIQTTAFNTLTLGGASTGNIVVSPNNGSGVLSLNVGTNGLLINGTPGANVTGSCVTTSNGIVTAGTVCETGLDTWTGNAALGVVNTSNNTMDILVGGTASSSAKFAILNVNPGSGTPTASVSAGVGGPGTYITATGNIQTTNNQSLSLGGSTTGNIVLNSDGINRVGIGTAAPTSTFTIVDGAMTLNASNATGLQVQTTGNTAWTNLGTNSTSTAILDLFDSSNTLVGRFNDSGRLGLGSSNPQARLDVRGNSGTLPIASFSGSTTNASLIIDNSGTGDLITASSSGLNRFVVKQNGNVGIGVTLPTAKLHIADSQVSSRVKLYLQNTNASTKSTAIALGVNSAATVWEFGTDYNNNNTDDLYLFGGGSGAARLYVNSTGSFGIGTNNLTPLATLDVKGNSGTTPVASVSGQTSNAALIVDNNGVGDLFTASKSGKTHFTIRNSGVVVIGTSTNGITFDPATGPNYAGTARPTKVITLSPEYAGAVLTASGSAVTNGFMTSDASTSAALNFRQYYEWSSSQTALNDYTVAVRVKLPQDFSAWTTTGAIVVDYNTELTSNTRNKFDLLLRTESAGAPTVYRQANVSGTQKTWTTLSIDAADLNDATTWNTAGQTAVIYLKMYSRDENYVQIGDITMSYLADF